MNPAQSRRIIARCRGRRDGFTLIEILCVIILMGIIAAVVAPTLGPQDDLSVSAAARIVVADLLYAQHHAIDTGENTYVRFIATDGNRNSGSYSIFADSGLAQTIFNPITGTSYSRAFCTDTRGAFADAAITGLNLNGTINTVLVFDSLGIPSVCPISNTDAPTLMSAAGSITLGCGSMTATILIMPDTGDITVSNVHSN